MKEDISLTSMLDCVSKTQCLCKTRTWILWDW